MCKDDVCFWLKPEAVRAAWHCCSLHVDRNLPDVARKLFPNETFRDKLNTGPNCSKQLSTSRCQQATRFSAVLTGGRVIKPKESTFHGCAFVCMPRSVVRVPAERTLHASTSSCAASPVACRHNGNWLAFLMTTGALFVAASTDNVPRELFVCLSN